MPLFVVTYEHPNESGWRQHLMPHVVWLQERLKDGSLVASGPFTSSVTKSALLIMNTIDRPVLESLIATDSFAEHDLIENMRISDWDPIFGVFNDRSSMPGQMQGS